MVVHLADAATADSAVMSARRPICFASAANRPVFALKPKQLWHVVVENDDIPFLNWVYQSKKQNARKIVVIEPHTSIFPS